MNKLLLLLFSTCLTSFFYSCSEHKIDVRTACELNKSGDYLIKWETFPPIDGKVKIYRSENPDFLENSQFEVEVPIQEGFVVVPHEKKLRSYFKLDFDSKVQTITSDRVVHAENIINIRDVGGYRNQEGRQVKWGKIYRSASLSNARKNDIDILNELGIKTLIDLRTDKESEISPPAFNAQQYIRIPFRSLNLQFVLKDILANKMTRNEVIDKQKDFHVNFIVQNADHLIRYFQILSDPNNYPLIVFCSMGKDRAGIVIAITLAALDVNEDQIHQDYMFSNTYVDYTRVMLNSDTLPDNAQEALSAFLIAQETTIKYTRHFLAEKYGSVEEYFSKELKMDNSKIEKLKDVLLYKKEEK